MAEEGLPAGVEMLLGLRDTLESLSDPKFLAVMDKLEIVRELPPVVALIDEARPRLRVLKPPRPHNLRRPLCVPFEDLFPLSLAGVGGTETVGRAIIAPLWNELQSKAGAAVGKLQVEYKAIRANNPRRLLELSETLWSLSAQVLQVGAIPGLPDETALLLRDIFAAATEIEAFKQARPRKPIPKLGDEDKSLIKEHMGALGARSVAVQGYLFIVAVRLEAPSDLLRWLRDMGQGVPAVVERFALGKLNNQIDRFESDAAQMTLEALAGSANELLASLTATEDALGTASRAALSARAGAVTTRLRDVVRTRIVDAAPSEITAALTDSTSVETLLAAEAHARALAKSRKSAAKIGLGTATDSAISSIRKACIGRIDEVLNAPPGDAAGGQERAVFQSIRMIELVDGAASARDAMLSARRRMKPKG